MACPIGTCKLCLRSGVELQDSHIVPRWPYKRVLREHRGLVQLRERNVIASHKQLSEHLLCADCEQLFGTTERAVGDLLAGRPGDTMLARSLGPSVARTDQFDIRPVPASVAATLSRFCAIMVWRASVSSKASHCKLGSRYEEEFRSYLAPPGAAYPSRASCFVWLHGGNILNGAFGSPVTNRSGTGHFHRFPLCGLEFLLFVGSQLPDHVQRLHLLRAENIGLGGPGQLDEWLRQAFEKATPRGRLARQA